MKKPPECAEYSCKASGYHGMPKMCETHDDVRIRLARKLSSDMLRTLFEIGERKKQFDRYNGHTLDALRRRGLIFYPVESEWSGALTDAGKEALANAPSGVPLQGDKP